MLFFRYAFIFLFNTTTSATDTRDKIPALENICRYDNADGNAPDTFGIVCVYICWNIPATDGPSDCPTKINSTDMPRDIPSNFCGDDTSMMLNPPTNAKDNPTDIIPSAADIIDSVEWNATSPKNPIVHTIVPSAVSLKFPTLDTINPDAAETISDMIINGSWTFAVVIASPPKPNGCGLCIKIGIVWYTMNVDMPTIMRMTFVGKSILFTRIFRSTNGNGVLFSSAINTNPDAAAAPKNTSEYRFPWLISCMYDTPMRNKMTVTESAIAPLMSIPWDCSELSTFGIRISFAMITAKIIATGNTEKNV